MCCKQNNIQTSKHHNMASSRDRDLMFFCLIQNFIGNIKIQKNNWNENFDF